MKNFNINVNRDAVSPEEIHSKKDFNSLLKQYHTTVKAGKPFYKTTFIKGVAAVTTVTVITTVMVWNYQAKSSKEKSAVQTQTRQSNTRTSTADKKPVKKSIIRPPVAGVNVKQEKYLVNASKGGSLKHKTGTMMNFPKNSFVDKAGQDVKGDVEIRYREFHDLADIIVSGIPMTYDSTGKIYHFESAGMMEIHAYQGDEQVYLASGKKVDVMMASANKDKNFNLYYLDTVSGKWLYKGRDKVTRNADNTRGFDATQGKGGNSTTRKLLELDKKIESTEGVAKETTTKVAVPVKPRKADASKYRFDIDFDKKEFPELASFKGLLFEVDENQKNFSTSIFRIEWEDIELLQGNKQGSNYRIKVRKGKSSTEINAYPVFEGDNYTHALEEYQAKYNDYKQKSEARREQERKQQEEAAAELARYKKEREEIIAQENKIKLSDLAYGSSDLSYLRVFKISGFGVWNCDRPNPFPFARNIMARFMDDKGRMISAGQPSVINTRIALNSGSQFFLIEDGSNTIYTYTLENGLVKEFRFNPEKQNIVWGLTDKGELVSFMREDFKTIPGNAKEFTFKMKKINAKMETVEDVRKYFGLIKENKNNI